MFEGKLGAQAAALALAGEIQGETGALPRIVSPWPVYPIDWVTGSAERPAALARSPHMTLANHSNAR